jgi:hypothetical protein
MISCEIVLLHVNINCIYIKPTVLIYIFIVIARFKYVNSMTVIDESDVSFWGYCSLLVMLLNGQSREKGMTSYHCG